MTSHSISPDLSGPRAARGAGTNWLIVLWVVWAVLLIGAMATGHFGERHAAALPTVARMGSSLTLVVAAWSAYFLWRAGARGACCCVWPSG